MDPIIIVRIKAPNILNLRFRLFTRKPVSQDKCNWEKGQELKFKFKGGKLEQTLDLTKFNGFLGKNSHP